MFTSVASDLFFLQDRLDNDLVSGAIDIYEYETHWEDVLALFGWTDQQFSDAVDDGWTVTHRVKIVAQA